MEKQTQVHPEFIGLNPKALQGYSLICFKINQEIIQWEKEKMIIFTLESNNLTDLSSTFQFTPKLLEQIKQNPFRYKAMQEMMVLSPSAFLQLTRDIIEENTKKLRNDIDILLLFEGWNETVVYSKQVLFQLVNFQIYSEIPEEIANDIFCKQQIMAMKLDFINQWNQCNEYLVELEEMKTRLKSIQEVMQASDADICIDPGLIGLNGIQEQIKVIKYKK